MKFFAFLFFALVFISKGGAQHQKPIRVKDFSYLFYYNAPTQNYSLEFYALKGHSERVDFLQIWVGNEYRDLAPCNHYFAPEIPHTAFSFAKKHSKNLTGKPPFKFQGEVLVVYRIRGQAKYLALKNPQKTYVKAELPLYPHLPIPCEY
jgi:hypothetical protein